MIYISIAALKDQRKSSAQNFDAITADLDPADRQKLYTCLGLDRYLLLHWWSVVRTPVYSVGFRPTTRAEPSPLKE